MGQPADASAIEQQIEGMPGVLRAAVLRDETGTAHEVQVFTDPAPRQPSIHKDVLQLLESHGHPVASDKIRVFKLASEGEGAVREPAATTRPRIVRVALEVGGTDCEATVSLVMDGVEAVGRGRSRRSRYALRVTAAAALEAAQALLGVKGTLTLKGASVVETLKRRMVIVLVHSSIAGDRMVVGAALVGDAPIHEATVRATMDAVNRQLELVSA